MKFLTKHNLPFRGNQDVHRFNKGNFIELVELMSKYDPFLRKQYLIEVNDNRRYLSPKIQNEFIHILGNHGKENILDRSQSFCDHTRQHDGPDQMSFICQYVIVEDKVEVQESFLDFIIELGKTTYDTCQEDDFGLTGKRET